MSRQIDQLKSNPDCTVLSMWALLIALPEITFRNDSLVAAAPNKSLFNRDIKSATEYAWQLIDRSGLNSMSVNAEKLLMCSIRRGCFFMAFM
jgi:hypothetical protein